MSMNELFWVKIKTRTKDKRDIQMNQHEPLTIDNSYKQDTIVAKVMMRSQMHAHEQNLIDKLAL